MDRRPETSDDGTGTGTLPAATVPRSVHLAVRGTWSVVGVMAVAVVLMAVFYNDVVGAWADHHEGARQVFDQGGRAGLQRAGFAPPSFLPVAATMVVVGAMIVWVLVVFLRLGYRWGQLGLAALMVGCAYASVALGFVLAPPPVFVVTAAVALLVEGVTLVCLWHPDTRAHVRGPWSDGSRAEGRSAEAGGRPAARGPSSSRSA